MAKRVGSGRVPKRGKPAASGYTAPDREVNGHGNELRFLTDRQRRFVAEFLVDFDAQEAARRTGAKGTSAKVQGCQLLAHPRVKAAIDGALTRYEQVREFDRRRHLEALDEVVRFDMSMLYGPDGKLLPVKDWPPTVKRAVKTLKVRQHERDDGSVVTTAEVEAYSRLEAIKLHSLLTGALDPKAGRTVNKTYNSLTVGGPGSSQGFSWGHLFADGSADPLPAEEDLKRLRAAPVQVDTQPSDDAPLSSQERSTDADDET